MCGDTRVIQERISVGLLERIVTGHEFSFWLLSNANLLCRSGLCFVSMEPGEDCSLWGRSIPVVHRTVKLSFNHVFESQFLRGTCVTLRWQYQCSAGWLLDTAGLSSSASQVLVPHPSLIPCVASFLQLLPHLAGILWGELFALSTTRQWSHVLGIFNRSSYLVSSNVWKGNIG